MGTITKLNGRKIKPQARTDRELKLLAKEGKIVEDALHWLNPPIIFSKNWRSIDLSLFVDEVRGCNIMLALLPCDDFRRQELLTHKLWFLMMLEETSLRIRQMNICRGRPHFWRKERESTPPLPTEPASQIAVSGI